MSNVPERVARFEFVSFEQFAEAMNDIGVYDTGFIRECYDQLKLPIRKTGGSAGHDFMIPYELHLNPGESAKIPTGIRVDIDPGWWLGCLPRSGLGTKYRVQLDNTMGVVDSDYYGAKNEGHIFLKITNDSKEGKALYLAAGESFAQGIFIPYGITYDDQVTDVRVGGMGSTGR